MIKVIDGVRKRVARLTYSNGTTVERVYPMNSDIPEDVKVVEKAKDTAAYNPHVHPHIVNQEFMQYAYHFGTH
jgi:ribosomal protein L19